MLSSVSYPEEEEEEVEEEEEDLRQIFPSNLHSPFKMLK